MWLIDRRITSVVRLRTALNDHTNPPGEIIKPYGMRTVEFDNKIRHLRWLEADLERILFEGLKS